ncbi:MAG: hypothetical protein FJY60_04795 [Betaproteobacteria bacterium]|nr:hypothetical protein [Betaproteobacteria bacterium]
MQRRRFIGNAVTLLAAGLWPAAQALAHTPYAQWDLFRKRNLQILTSHSDLPGDAIGDEWVDFLRKKLPLSRAMVSRARDVARVASLLKTDQSKLAVLSYQHAQAMMTAATPFEDYPNMPLQIMFDNGTHVLVAREDLPLHHGFLIAVTLLEAAGPMHLSMPLEGKFGMKVHPGARAAALGEKIELPRSEGK